MEDADLIALGTLALIAWMLLQLPRYSNPPVSPNERFWEPHRRWGR